VAFNVFGYFHQSANLEPDVLSLLIVATIPFIWNLKAQVEVALGREKHMRAPITSFLKLNMGEGTQISPEVVKSLGDLGWQPVQGSYDFVYRWEADWEKNGKGRPEFSDEIKALVETALKAHDIRYVLKTFDSVSDGGS
jgi:hypothetical protein